MLFFLFRLFSNHKTIATQLAVFLLYVAWFSNIIVQNIVLCINVNIDHLESFGLCSLLF